MSSNNTTSGNTSASEFVLNASDSDHTQMYMVQAPDDNFSVASATIGNLTTPNSFIKVLLQMPVFDADSAQLKSYCATFDPRPSNPAQMTVESCMDGASPDEHKSQVFAFEPGTGVIRPVWSEEFSSNSTSAGSVDTPSADGADDDGPAEVPPDESSQVGGTSSGNNSSTTTSSMANNNGSSDVTSSSFDQEALNEEYGEDTRPALRFAHSFSVEKAQNVTLVFSPAAPEVFPHSTASDSATASGASSTATGSPAFTTNALGVAQQTASTTSGALSSSSSSRPTAADRAMATTTSSSTSTPTPTELEVKVYNPYASDASSPSASASGSSSGAGGASSTVSEESSAQAFGAQGSPFAAWRVAKRMLEDLD